jgi:hypothetical protein
MDYETLTYDQAAQPLAITKRSAKRIVARHNGQRWKGPDQRTLIAVPRTELERLRDGCNRLAGNRRQEGKEP